MSDPPVVSEMSDESSSAMVSMRAELGSLRRVLEQRESALAALNRRLMTLERTDARATDERLAGLSEQLIAHERTIADLTAQIAELTGQVENARSEAARLDDEIHRIYATRLFRYASPLRRVYRVIRRP
jgi:chromosome segregation ATPase